MGQKKTIPELDDKELISAWKEADEEQDPRVYADLAVEMQKRFTNYHYYLGITAVFPMCGIALFLDEDFSTVKIITFCIVSVAIPLLIWAYGRWKMSRILLKTGHTWFDLPYVDAEKIAELRKYSPKSNSYQPMVDVETLPQPPPGENIDARGPQAAVIAIPVTLSLWLACYIFIMNGTLLERLGIEIFTHTKFKYTMSIVCAFHFPLQLWLRFRTPDLDHRD